MIYLNQNNAFNTLKVSNVGASQSESAFRQTDVTFYVLVPAMLLLSFITQQYWHFP